MYKKAQKWAKSEDLEGLAYNLMATLLSHGPKKTFENEFDTLLQKKIFKKMFNAKTDKRRDDYMNSLLTLLRGRFTGNRISWLPYTTFRQLQATVLSPYCFTPLSKDIKKMPGRMATIISTLYSKKVIGIKNPEAISLLTEIGVQLAAHRSVNRTNDWLID